MTRTTFPNPINPAITSGTQLAALLNDRTTADFSGHAGTGRPAYATAGMVYTENSGPAPRLFLAIGTAGPDVDLSALFADRPGTIRVTAEVRLGVGWLWCDGAAVARITYPALFDAICPAFTGTTAVGSTTITAVSESFVGLGMVGAKIEGAGAIPAGAVVTAVAANSLTISIAASAALTNTPLRLFPHGTTASTNFNVPNCKGRALIGRDDMGGTLAGQITVAGAGFDGKIIGNVGGGQTIQLAIANLPAHDHPVSLSGTASVSTDPGHTHVTDTHPGHVHNAGTLKGKGSTGGGGQINWAQSGTAGSASQFAIDITGETTGNGAHSHNVALGGAHSHVVTLTLGATSSNTPGAVAAPIVNVQPSIIENYVIKT